MGEPGSFDIGAMAVSVPSRHLQVGISRAASRPAPPDQLHYHSFPHVPCGGFMRWSIVHTAIGLAISASVASGQAQPAERMNRMIPLIQQKLPVLGVNNPAYAPGGRGGGRSRGRGAAADTVAPTTPPPA